MSRPAPAEPLGGTTPAADARRRPGFKFAQKRGGRKGGVGQSPVAGDLWPLLPFAPSDASQP